MIGQKPDKTEDEEITTFDNFFKDCPDEFTIGLYEVPEGKKRRREHIEDFASERPSNDYIAREYGAGHYVAMGEDSKGKILHSAIKKYKPCDTICGNWIFLLSPVIKSSLFIITE